MCRLGSQHRLAKGKWEQDGGGGGMLFPNTKGWVPCLPPSRCQPCQAAISSALVVVCLNEGLPSLLQACHVLSGEMWMGRVGA